MATKLDTTGLTGKERILMLAEIIKANETGREVEMCLPGYPGRLGPVFDRWATLGAPFFDSNTDYRIKPITKTYYVNLYPVGTRKPFQSYTLSKTELDAQDRARQEGGAIAVAVPVTIEE